MFNGDKTYDNQTGEINSAEELHIETDHRVAGTHMLSERGPESICN